LVSVVAIGDNLVDRYLNLRKYFPGGNSLNVSVFARRYGASAAFIGCMGNDVEGQHICRALDKEGVDRSHCQIVNAPTRYAVVNLIDGERTFLPGGNKETNRMLRIGPDDLEFMKQFDIIYTNINSYLEGWLPELKKLGPKIAFDYSDFSDLSYVEKSIPYVEYSIFSENEKSENEIKALQKKIAAKGAKLVLVTRGAKGAILYHNQQYYSIKAVETTVVDTLGCGDSFFASFLVNFFNGQDAEKSLTKAVTDAAETCSYYGAFSYGVDY